MIGLLFVAACGGGGTDTVVDTVGTDAAAQPAADSAPAMGPAPVAFDTAAARGERPLLREVYRWDPAPRDPFRPMFVSELTGPELPDLLLSSVIYQRSDPSRSIAIFQDRGSSKRYSVSPGQRIGRLTVVEIGPGTATLRMNDFGTLRDQTYHVRRSEDGTP
jgi:hypothetical protein